MGMEAVASNSGNRKEEMDNGDELRGAMMAQARHEIADQLSKGRSLDEVRKWLEEQNGNLTETERFLLGHYLDRLASQGPFAARYMQALEALENLAG